VATFQRLLESADGHPVTIGVNLTFDPTLLFLPLIPRGIGFVLKVYGKKQAGWVRPSR